MGKTKILSSGDYFAKMTKSLKFASSYERLPVMLDFVPWRASQQWLQELGIQWGGCDNVGLHANQITSSIQIENYEECYPIDVMMDADGTQAFDNLPEAATIYRGCYEENKWGGLCWTLGRTLAEQFPFMPRYAGKRRPLLIKAELQKRDMVAVKLDRNEAEITFTRPKCISNSAALNIAPQTLKD